MEFARISIAMATYNGEKYLAEQLDSLVAQTLRPCEIIICDDCSRDSTMGILRQYEGKYPKLIKVYANNSNLGYVKNFEKAMNLCTGEYIALSDQDDVWVPSKLEKLVARIGDCAMVHSDAILVDKDNNEISPSFSDALNKIGTPCFLELLNRSQITGCTMMCKRDKFPEVFSFPKGIPHDYYLSFLAAEKGIAYEPEPLVRYRQHDKNQIGFKRQQKPTLKSIVIRAIGIVKEVFFAKDPFYTTRRQLISQLEPYIRGNVPEKSYKEFEDFSYFVNSRSRKRIIDIEFHRMFKKYYVYIDNPTLLVKLRLALSWFNW